MANIWKVNSEVNDHPNRNNFDLTFQNHLTMKMGTLYPIMCKEVLPGDSFRIDTAFGLKFMPLVFPVQSKMTAYVHYFYVRNKNLWKNWENWINGLEDHTHPYIDQPSSFFRTGSLADYLDLPTTRISYNDEYEVLTADGSNSGGRFNIVGSTVVNAANGTISDYSTSNEYQSLALSNTFNEVGYGLGSQYPHFLHGGSPQLGIGISNSFWYCLQYQYFNYNFSSDADLYLNIPYIQASYSTYASASTGVSTNPAEIFSHAQFYVYVRPRGLGRPTLLNISSFEAVDAPVMVDGRLHVTMFYDHDAVKSYIQSIPLLNSSYESGDLEFSLVIAWQPIDFADPSDPPDYGLPITWTEGNKPVSGLISSLQAPVVIFHLTTLAQLEDSDSVKPFGNDANSDHKFGISALPFRAYESIYHAYYRNTQNQQFYIDGVPQYNRYNTTLEDGADSTEYHLFQRNYEMDFLTSCLPSPQQGVAPLVGMTALGDLTISDENGVTTAHAEIDNDGTITKVALTSPAASIDHARTAMNIAAAGMSINDFRNVNAFQRWLETNLRKGYRYLDFIEGHFGKAPQYRELDMPEFIGGTSQQITVSQVTNMADTESISGNSGKLGSFVGSANCFGGTKHSVSHYFDDYGFIVGIMCIVPTPSYSQLLPKMWLKSDKLDYYFPEFSQLGLQPITYKEVTPIQSYYECLVDNSKLMTDTFGYQRPNYDLVGYVDQVHGQFRSTLSSFLISRLFGIRPELGSEFLVINPADTNHIFSYSQPAEDNILGQVVVKISAKRPVPRVTIPSLGR